jgi:hypothetical protein
MKNTFGLRKVIRESKAVGKNILEAVGNAEG